MANKPKWATPTRQTCLVKVFVRSRGFCVFGHPKCLIPEHHYELYIEALIADWIAGDRTQSLAEWQAEYKARHSTNDRRYPLHGQFSGVSQDVFFDKQPAFFIEGLGVSGLTYKPFAKLRLASSFMRLHVDLADTLKPVSKNKKRKALRYGKIPNELQDKIHNACWLAVKHYLNSW